MQVLIVEERFNRGQIWKQFLERQGAKVSHVASSNAATVELNRRKYDALVINIAMANSAVLAVSDLAGYKYPDIAIITVTSGSFFSDGSIFKMIPNARGCVGADISPKDLAEMVEHYGNQSKERGRSPETNQ